MLKLYLLIIIIYINDKENKVYFKNKLLKQDYKR